MPLIFDPVKEEDFNTHFTCIASNSRGQEVHAVKVEQEGTCLDVLMSLLPSLSTYGSAPLPNTNDSLLFFFTEPHLSWHLALIPLGLTIMILGGICMHKYWKQRSPRGYAATKS